MRGEWWILIEPWHVIYVVVVVVVVVSDPEAFELSPFCQMLF